MRPPIPALSAGPLPTLLLTLLLASCASRPLPAPAPSEQVKSASLAVVDANDVALPARPAGSLWATFPLVAGSLAGKTSADAVLAVPADFAKPLDIPLARLALLVAPRALPLSEQALSDGVRVLPSEARVARVGTFFSRSTAEPIGVGAGFVDEQTRANLLLVYVDRPCEFSGVVHAGAVRLQTSFSLPSAGLHWLRIRKTTPSEWQLERAHPDVPVSMVTQGPL